MRIRDRARDCEKYKRPEVALGDDVVRPMMELVREMLGLGDKVLVENMYVEGCPLSGGEYSLLHIISYLVFRLLQLE